MLLTIMNRKWSQLGIEEWFTEVNHVSSFSSKDDSSTLQSFVNYCEHVRIKKQNAQTIDRALEVARYVEKGIAPSTAIRIAWQSYPLVEA